MMNAHAIQPTELVAGYRSPYRYYIPKALILKKKFIRFFKLNERNEGF